jgi:hypothetical protein
MESGLKLLDLEPVGVEGHHVRRAVLLVIAVEVLLEPLEYLGGVVVVENALVQVWAVAAFISLDVMGVQRDFPDTLTNLFISFKAIFDCWL